MSTLLELIRKGHHKPVRRCFIKRRILPSGGHEGSFTRVDNKFGRFIRDRVLDWGSASWEINNEPGQIPSFNVSSLRLRFNNEDGFFNREDNANSFWNPEGSFIRRFSIVKIETAYLDTDGTEVGTANTFEGVIEKVQINDNETATLTILSYQVILQRFDISDLSLAGNDTVSNIVTAIMNQSKITVFIPFNAPAPDQDVTIDQTTLTGTYWEVIKFLAFRSNSIPLLISNDFNFKARTPSASIIFDFIGRGAGDPQDIFKVTSYDDEGADRVRVLWKDSAGSTTAKSVDATLLTKYLEDPQTIDLSSLTSGAEKQTLLDALLGEWERPKAVIDFETRFLVNEIEPLNKITIDIRANAFATVRWDDGTLWDDGSRWGSSVGSVIIGGGLLWIVTKITKNFQSWKSKIRAERLV